VSWFLFRVFSFSLLVLLVFLFPLSLARSLALSLSHAFSMKRKHQRRQQQQGQARTRDLPGLRSGLLQQASFSGQRPRVRRRPHWSRGRARSWHALCLRPGRENTQERGAREGVCGPEEFGRIRSRGVGSASISFRLSVVRRSTTSVKDRVFSVSFLCLFLYFCAITVKMKEYSYRE